MEKQTIDIETPTKITQKIIYDLYCDHYDSIHSLFIESIVILITNSYKSCTFA